MKRFHSHTSALLLVRPVLLGALIGAVGVVAHATPAQAYLDPGTGSMVLQLIMGGVAGAMVIGKLYWQRLKSVFGISSPDAAEELPPGSKSSETDAD